MVHTRLPVPETFAAIATDWCLQKLPNTPCACWEWQPAPPRAGLSTTGQDGRLVKHTSRSSDLTTTRVWLPNIRVALHTRCATRAQNHSASRRRACTCPARHRAPPRSQVQRSEPHFGGQLASLSRLQGSAPMVSGLSTNQEHQSTRQHDSWGSLHTRGVTTHGISRIRARSPGRHIPKVSRRSKGKAPFADGHRGAKRSHKCGGTRRSCVLAQPSVHRPGAPQHSGLLDAHAVRQLSRTTTTQAIKNSQESTCIT